MNKVQLIGNVVKEPQIKDFNDGGKIANVTLATTKRGYKTKDGKEIPDKSEFHNLVFSGGLAKVISQYVKKGDKLYVEGELATRSYESNGVAKYITEIKVNEMEMLTPKPKEPIAVEVVNDGLPF